MKALVVELLDDSRGQDVIEYALIASVILLVCAVGSDAVLSVIGSAFTTIFGAVE
jgi:Flp pilus assembly pilin Flp